MPKNGASVARTICIPGYDDRSAASTASCSLTAAPKSDAPKYVERPALVDDTKSDLTGTETAKPVTSRTSSGPRVEKPRRQRYWTEGRIINELHRHGIYW